MAPDLLTLSAICHEESNHPVTPPPQEESGLDSKVLQPQISASDLVQSTTNVMGNPSDARKRSLASIYSTGFVFNQNQKQLVQSLPWSSALASNSSITTTHRNPVPTSTEMQKLVSQIAEGRGNGRKSIAEEQIQGIRSEKVRREHAASMFALLI